jgi:hypothetical protein
MDIEKISEGMKVNYKSNHGEPENGIVKAIGVAIVFVVYKCNNDWDNYKNYTAAATHPGSLKAGWADND